MTDMTHLIETARSRAQATESMDRHHQHTATILRKLADALTDLDARLRIETKRAQDAEALNDFLIAELDKLIEKASLQR